jgi:hypothetical protein
MLNPKKNMKKCIKVSGQYNRNFCANQEKIA